MVLQTKKFGWIARENSQCPYIPKFRASISFLKCEFYIQNHIVKILLPSLAHACNGKSFIRTLVRAENFWHGFLEMGAIDMPEGCNGTKKYIQAMLRSCRGRRRIKIWSESFNELVEKQYKLCTKTSTTLRLKKKETCLVEVSFVMKT